jgi:hypothetical protein
VRSQTIEQQHCRGANASEMFAEPVMFSKGHTEELQSRARNE